MKNLAKLNGAKALSKNEQKSINGGVGTKPNSCCNPANDCCVFNSWSKGCTFSYSQFPMCL